MWLSPSPVPPLTLDNVMVAVKGTKNWRRLRSYFGVNGIYRDQHASDEACLKAVVEEFLLGEAFYQPTWRAVIYCLDRTDDVALADKIRKFGEPVQGAWVCMQLRLSDCNHTMYAPGGRGL